jgi:hypothetical protein
MQEVRGSIPLSSTIVRVAGATGPLSGHRRPWTSLRFVHLGAIPLNSTIVRVAGATGLFRVIGVRGLRFASSTSARFPSAPLLSGWLAPPRPLSGHRRRWTSLGMNWSACSSSVRVSTIVVPPSSSSRSTRIGLRRAASMRSLVWQAYELLIRSNVPRCHSLHYRQIGSSSYDPFLAPRRPVDPYRRLDSFDAKDASDLLSIRNAESGGLAPTEPGVGAKQTGTKCLDGSGALSRPRRRGAQSPARCRDTLRKAITSALTETRLCSVVREASTVTSSRP